MLFLIAIAFLLKRYGTQAVPLPAPTSTSSPFDMPIFARDNPSDGCHSRTVLDILWSCLATTFACTWVSVHPNVPFKGEGKWTLLGRRIYLMFFSILAPEFMIVWAFKQWRGAVMIREGVNKALKNATPSTAKPLWTTAHGHFLQMGGFRLLNTAREMHYYNDSGTLRKRDDALIPASLVISPQRGNRVTGLISQDLCEHADTKWPYKLSADALRAGLGTGFREGVLTYDALQKLLVEDLIRFPNINEGEISDRSKGDALSKGIALLQLTWFIVQIITRVVQGLAITELELTTAALAGLNSVMYIFWWGKPRDVRFPVVIRTKGVEKLIAERTEGTTWNFSDPEEFDFRLHLWTSMSTPIKDVLGGLRNFLVSSPKTIRNMFSNLGRAISVLPGHLYSFLSRSHQYFTRVKGAKSGDPNRTGEKVGSAVADPEPNRDKESESRMQQIYGALISGAKAVVYCFAFLSSVLSYVIDFGLVQPIAQITISDDNEGTLPMVFDAGKQVRVLFMMFYSEDAEVKPLLSTASIAGALFGGVHCLAWHFSFPSHAEQIMWRTASLGIAGVCASSFLGTYTGSYVAAIFELLPALLMILTAAVYPVFRLMLLVLAVFSLRSLSPSAYDTVQWIEFVPHI